MIQEEKDILLKYLCMALPYGVKVQYIDSYGHNHVGKLLCVNAEYIEEVKVNWGDDYTFEEDFSMLLFSEVRPYLRPLSSMTEEEINELHSLCEEDLTDFSKHIADGHGLSYDGLYMFPNIRQLNWLLEHHFDFMGLIPMDSAIEVTKDNNPYND